MDTDLPQYHRTDTALSNNPSSSRVTRAPTEHQYHLPTSKSRPWLSLSVLSKAPASTYLPAFYQGEPITGSVTLRLEKEEPIKSVSVQVLGQMTSSATDVLTFLHTSTAVWPASSSASFGVVPATSNPGKLFGEYTWPFSVTLPDHCTLKSPGVPEQQFSLPASFSERMARVHIQYQIVVTVHRSRFRVDSTLGTVIGYLPIIRPDPPSTPRQIAYMENSPLIGPDGDPDGWLSLEPLPIQGSVFSTRTVDATCTLALAKPLCYTRGTAIPCLMTIETTDPQALDLLSAPRSPVVRLLRRISAQDTGPFNVPKPLPGLEFESTVQEVATAVWWSEHARDRLSPQKRVLHGEIHLSASLKPSCRFGKFELSYSVALYPPRAVAFMPDGGANAILQREPVVIGTVYAAGPRPRIRSPPGYDDASSTGKASEFQLFRAGRVVLRLMISQGSARSLTALLERPPGPSAAFLSLECTKCCIAALYS